MNTTFRILQGLIILTTFALLAALSLVNPSINAEYNSGKLFNSAIILLLNILNLFIGLRGLNIRDMNFAAKINPVIILSVMSLFFVLISGAYLVSQGWKYVLSLLA